MAEAVVSYVVERIGDLLIEEAKLLGGVSKQVNQMQIELKRMRCFLKDADRRQYEDESIRNWISEIRDVAHDAEDVIETFAVKVASKDASRTQNLIKKHASMFNKGRELHKVGTEMEAIKTKISDLTRSLQSYGLNAVKEGEGSAERRRQLRWSYSHIVEDYIVGFEENIKELVSQLVSEERNCKVVSVCGMGGLGKTTLAKQVYFHSESRRHFDGFAWAYISQQCKRRDVWQGILLKLITPSKEERDEIIKMNDEELAKKLYRVQQEKKCLVILDDIWSTEAWTTLSPAFPVRKGATKILITTRNKDVALHVDPRGFLHEPMCLSEEESWKLFQNKAFKREDDQDIEFLEGKEKLGREMVKRCAGLPLAIIVLGGLLAAKETLDEWDMVHRNIVSYLRRGKGADQSSTISEVLALSYHELPYQLKPCFLHLGHFPEDFDIPVKKLIRLWVSEGIVSLLEPEAEGGETMEDLAERYLGVLMSRSMVQVGTIGSTGKIKSCRLHDLMRDLCLSKASEENFLQIINRGHGNETVDSLSTGRIRRLSIFSDHYVHGFVPPALKKNPHLRSLIYFQEKKQRIEDWQLLKPVFQCFKLLKLLDLEGIKGLKGTLPEDIGSLIQLRFLSLKNSRIREIPSSIGNLRYLQSLDLRMVNKVSWESTVQVPNVLWKMEQLRHLYLPKWCGNVSDKLDLANLKHLQTLVNFPASKCELKDLIQLSNLKKLVLNDPRYFQKFVEIFKPNNKLNCLKSLSLKTDTLSFPDVVVDLKQLLSGCPSLYKLHVEGQIEMLPGHLQFPPNLTKLTLWGSRLTEDPMPTLEKLPNLRYLSGWEVFTGSKMVCSKNGFPKLKSLLLRGLPNLEEWTIVEGAMARLSRLGISDCNKLKTAPDGFRYLTALSELEIRWMPIAFKKRLDKEGESFCKVQHVPSIVFLN